jgi:hypothetical protein
MMPPKNSIRLQTDLIAYHIETRREFGLKKVLAVWRRSNNHGIGCAAALLRAQLFSREPGEAR